MTRIPKRYHRIDDDQEEIWKEVAGLEGYYEVSTRGRIRSVARSVLCSDGRTLTYEQTVLKPATTQQYRRVYLSRDGWHKTFQVHRLVAIAFIPNPLNKPDVNHINGLSGGDGVDNLEWVTPSENVRHAYATLGRSASGKGKFGAENKNSKPITIGGVTYPAIREAARQLGVTPAAIYLANRKGKPFRGMQICFEQQPKKEKK